MGREAGTISVSLMRALSSVVASRWSRGTHGKYASPRQSPAGTRVEQNHQIQKRSKTINLQNS